MNERDVPFSIIRRWIHYTVLFTFNLKSERGMQTKPIFSVSKSHIYIRICVEVYSVIFGTNFNNIMISTLGLQYIHTSFPCQFKTKNMFIILRMRRIWISSQRNWFKMSGVPLKKSVYSLQYIFKRFSLKIVILLLTTNSICLFLCFFWN